LDLVVRASTMISSWTSPWLTSRLSACFLHDEDFVFILHGFVLMDQSLTDFQVVGVLLAWGFVCLMHTYSICLQASRGYFLVYAFARLPLHLDCRVMLGIGSGIDTAPSVLPESPPLVLATTCALFLTEGGSKSVGSHRSEHRPE
jgi:hypothetical protein